MKIEKGGYNVPVVVTGVKLIAGESVTLGTQADLDQLVELTSKSGLMRVKTATEISGQTMNFDGTCSCNFFDGNIEFHTVVYASDSITGGDPIIVGGQLYMEGTALKCHLTAVSVSSAAKTKTSK